MKTHIKNKQHIRMQLLCAIEMATLCFNGVFLPLCVDLGGDIFALGAIVSHTVIEEGSGSCGGAVTVGSGISVAPDDPLIAFADSPDHSLSDV